MRDYALETTFDVKFTTRRFTTGVPFALASGAVSAYPDNSTTQITAGITLTADFDGVTGLNNVRVVATAGNGYAAGSNYALVITTGTVDSVSVVGEVVAEFSLSAQSWVASIAAVKVDTAAILVDTGTTLDGKIDVIDGIVDSILVDTGTTLDGKIDTIDTVVDAILADTNELQTDWANGGRLDLLIDAIKAKTDNLPVSVKKNTALAKFEFLMVDVADGFTPVTGAVITAERSIDGGAFASCANSVTELSNGIYWIDLAASDLNGNVITLRFSAGSTADRFVTIVTQT